MKINLAPGKYIVAVSGGVDSMVLLHLLSKTPNIGLVVGHFNHGTREDAQLDQELVRQSAKKLKVPFELGYGNLGSYASEQTARNARYKFLNDIKMKHRADNVITAHHQDDLIETALINVLRGTGPRGLVAINSNPDILRPLINYPKGDVLRYARDNQIVWREDLSNQDNRYLRNYLRKNILDKLSDSQRQALIKRLDKLTLSGKEMDSLVQNLSAIVKKDDEIDRQKFIELPLEVGIQLVIYWLRQLGYGHFDKKNIDKLAMTLKTGSANTRHNILGDLVLVLSKNKASLERTA